MCNRNRVTGCGYRILSKLVLDYTCLFFSLGVSVSFLLWSCFIANFCPWIKNFLRICVSIVRNRLIFIAYGMAKLAFFCSFIFFCFCVCLCLSVFLFLPLFITPSLVLLYTMYIFRTFINML